MSSLFDEAVDWLKIPSVSAGERNDAALREAAEWAVKRVLDAGGTCELVETAGGAPLVVGELRASSRDDAPTVMIYGHYDVQDPGDPPTGPRPPSSRRSATAVCTPAARPTTRATSSRCCTSRARWPPTGRCRCTSAC